MVGGLTTDEIARAFLSSEAAIAQRIVREEGDPKGRIVAPSPVVDLNRAIAYGMADLLFRGVEKR